ncbi:nicotinate phosphoribosyltransferase [Azospirillum sp. ST 5-10]|uniref:nicotinate phosphoribosyltransferase n=1 Tax=unclassified Azospirillum TaxID=2630922 RepID=UPI003F4A0167
MDETDPVAAGNRLLLTDYYQLTMFQAYHAHGLTDTAVFELFVRKLPARRAFLMAAGLEQAVAFLETFRCPEEDLDWLARERGLPAATVDRLRGLRFTGDVDAMPEGTVFFAHEPVLRVAAPLPQAQLVETRLVNLIHFQTVVASKAARMVLAAGGRTLVDFGLRRAHGAEAGLLAARASHLAGFAATATTLAGRCYGIPVVGTMAHSFIQAHDSERTAFEHFARARPQDLVLLLDTYDTEAAARTVVEMAPRLAADGIAVAGVRLDSGDLGALAAAVRRILDAGGLAATRILASGGLDEDAIAALVAAGAPIDAFGVGTALTTAADAPALDCAYKLVEYAGRPRRKRSPGKATWPGRKQVFRHHDAAGRIAADRVALAGSDGAGSDGAGSDGAGSDAAGGRPLLVPVLRGGRRVAPLPALAALRAHAAAELASLPRPLRALDAAGTLAAAIDPALDRLAEEADRLASGGRP